MTDKKTNKKKTQGLAQLKATYAKDIQRIRQDLLKRMAQYKVKVPAHIKGDLKLAVHELTKASRLLQDTSSRALKKLSDAIKSKKKSR